MVAKKDYESKSQCPDRRHFSKPLKMMLEGGLGFFFKEDKIASAFVQTCILMQESKSIQQIIGN